MVRIVCFTYLLFSVTNLLVGALKCVETVRIGLALSVSTLCINVCINYCLIFGRFGLPRLGSAGAAVATLVSRAVELIILLVYLLHRDQKLRFRLRELLTPDFSFLPDLTRAGGPIFISNGIWGLAMAVQTGRSWATSAPAPSPPTASPPLSFRSSASSATARRRPRA